MGQYRQVQRCLEDDYKHGDRRPAPFANEKPLFAISAKNMDQYADKLTDGFSD